MAPSLPSILFKFAYVPCPGVGYILGESLALEPLAPPKTKRSWREEVGVQRPVYLQCGMGYWDFLQVQHPELVELRSTVLGHCNARIANCFYSEVPPPQHTPTIPVSYLWCTAANSPS